jgi:hypothetical protein
MREIKQNTGTTPSNTHIDIDRSLQISTEAMPLLEGSLMPKAQGRDMSDQATGEKSSRVNSLPPYLVQRSLLDTEQAAAYLNVGKRFLADSRLTGKGPRFVEASYHQIRYRLEDLDAWVQEKLRTSTAQAKRR